MKLLIDSEEQYMASALNVFFRHLSQNPNQEVGSLGAITTKSLGRSYEITRNTDSWTVRVS